MQDLTKYMRMRRNEYERIRSVLETVEPERPLTAREILELLEEHDAVGLFHLAKGVHDEAELDDFRARFDGVVELSEGGSVTTDF